jgi:hypothetical protein
LTPGEARRTIEERDSLPTAADDRRTSGIPRRALRWWRARSRRTRLGLLLGAATIAVMIPIATTQLHFESAGASGDVPAQSTPDLKTRLELARRYAPVLRLDSKELFVPISAVQYLAATDLVSAVGRLKSVLLHAPLLDSLNRDDDCLTAEPACSLFLDVRGANPPLSRPSAYGKIQRGLMKVGAKPVVYAHVTRYDDAGDFAVQYWFLYLYNYRLNDHESDWEQITIHLDADKQPIEAFYSSHATGQKRLWGRMEKVGTHPVDYAARGSHANYFTRGSHPVTILCTPLRKRLNVCVKKRTVLDFASGTRVLQPGRDYRIRELLGPAFVGGWGSGNFVAGTKTKDVVSDPRLRPAWNDPLSRFDRAKLIAKL